MTQCYIQDAAGPCRCDNCNWEGPAEQLDMISDIEQRLNAGGVVPAGQCPECGALAYLDARAQIAEAAGWKHGGDNGGFWFHVGTWGSWKAAASWSGTDQQPEGAYAKPTLYDTLGDLCAGEGLAGGAR